MHCHQDHHDDTNDSAVYTKLASDHSAVYTKILEKGPNDSSHNDYISISV